MKIIYIGSSSSSLSLIPLQALIKSKHDVCAIAFDDYTQSDFNVINSNSIQSLALIDSIPLIKLSKNYTDEISLLSSYQADVILVSCYSRLLPQSILSIAKKGCFNIHPSLLPSFRGPSPLFWQFREGINDFGVTLHRMTAEFDSGNIISQESITMRGGVNINEATMFLAKTASYLILNTLDNINNGDVIEIKQKSRLASYQSYPIENDYKVSILWSAKRIYNFIKAYKETDVSFLCKVNDEYFKISDVLSYQSDPYNNMNGQRIMRDGGELMVACKKGYIKCKIRLD